MKYTDPSIGYMAGGDGTFADNVVGTVRTDYDEDGQTTDDGPNITSLPDPTDPSSYSGDTTEDPYTEPRRENLGGTSGGPSMDPRNEAGGGVSITTIVAAVVALGAVLFSITEE